MMDSEDAPAFACELRAGREDAEESEEAEIDDDEFAAIDEEESEVGVASAFFSSERRLGSASTTTVGSERKITEPIMSATFFMLIACGSRIRRTLRRRYGDK